jgi:hypothetical protein
MEPYNQEIRTASTRRGSSRCAPPVAATYAAERRRPSARGRDGAHLGRGAPGALWPRRCPCARSGEALVANEEAYGQHRRDDRQHRPRRPRCHVLEPGELVRDVGQVRLPSRPASSLAVGESSPAEADPCSRPSVISATVHSRPSNTRRCSSLASSASVGRSEERTLVGEAFEEVPAANTRWMCCPRD